jgi:hypothetical protein
MDRLPVDEPELVLLGSGVSLGPVESPRVQAMLERMAVLGAATAAPGLVVEGATIESGEDLAGDLRR